MRLIDSGCSRHMTGNPKWFSSLTPVSTKEYINFGDNNKGKIISEGAIKVSDNVTLKRVALVRPPGYNLSQFLNCLMKVLRCVSNVVLHEFLIPRVSLCV